MSIEIRPRYCRGVPHCSADCPAWRTRVRRDGAMYKHGGGHCVLEPNGSVLRSNSSCYPAAEADREELVQLHGDGAYYFSTLSSEPSGSNWVSPADAFKEQWQRDHGKRYPWSEDRWVWIGEVER